MLRLLLVDDETSTRMGLLEHIDWRALGIDEVAGARDGQEGLAVASTLQPDILISDIRMPGMSGIDLAHEMRAMLPQCHIIFISGYSDKEYLKAAIRFGAISYVEKPIDLDELTEAIRQAVKLCLDAQQAKDRPLTEDDLIQRVLRKEPQALAEIEKRLCVASEAAHLTVLLLKSHRGRTQSTQVHTALRQALRRYPRVCGSYDDQYVGIVSGFKPDGLHRDANTFFTTISHLCRGEHLLFCAVGICVDNVAKIKVSYDAAQTALKRLFFRGYGHIVFFQEQAPPTLDLNEYDESAFLRLVQGMNMEGILSFIHALCKAVKMALGVREGQVKDLFLKYSFALKREAERRGIPLESSDAEGEKFFWNNVSDASTLDSLRDLFLTHMEQAMRVFQSLEANNRSIALVLKDIQENYHDPDLSIKLLAERAFLTPTYLSSLFKKVTGQTASEYIVWYRIEKAKELLMSGNAKLVEIAKNVGYGDANYFTKAFKQQTGMTPSKFRESNGL